MNTVIILLLIVLSFASGYASFSLIMHKNKQIDELEQQLIRLIMHKNKQIDELEQQLIKEIANLQNNNFSLMSSLVNNLFRRINVSVMNGDIDQETGIYLVDLLSPLATFFTEEMHISYMLYEYRDDSREYNNVARQAFLDAAKKFSEKKGLVNDNEM